MLLWCQSSVHLAEDEDQKTLLLPYLQEDGRLKSSFSCFYFQLSFSSLEFESYYALRLLYAGCGRMNYIVHCKEHGCLALCAWEESLIKQVNCNIVFYTWTACTELSLALALFWLHWGSWLHAQWIGMRALDPSFTCWYMLIIWSSWSGNELRTQQKKIAFPSG